MKKPFDFGGKVTLKTKFGIPGLSAPQWRTPTLCAVNWKLLHIYRKVYRTLMDKIQCDMVAQIELKYRDNSNLRTNFCIFCFWGFQWKTKHWCCLIQQKSWSMKKLTMTLIDVIRPLPLANWNFRRAVFCFIHLSAIPLWLFWKDLCKWESVKKDVDGYSPIGSYRKSCVSRRHNWNWRIFLPSSAIENGEKNNVDDRQFRSVS